MKALIKWKYGKWIAYSLPILWLPAIVLAFFATRTRDSWQNFYADTVHETVFQYYFGESSSSLLAFKKILMIEYYFLFSI